MKFERVFIENIPAHLTPLIGREQEVASVHVLLQHPEIRLLTLTGTGGVGKTRLGQQVATDVQMLFADGVYFVPLASIRESALVVPAIAQTLGLKEAGNRFLPDLLKAHLQDKDLLLLLDNFEQVLEAGPALTELLMDCPRLKMLVTSRAVLHISGEHEFPVPPLALPDLNRLPKTENLPQYAAVALFLQRARTIKSNFQMTDTNAREIVEICARLDGLPLAIELAVARLKLLTPQALLARLEHRLKVLNSGAKDLPARQQMLWNTITWSYDLLDANEQHLFRQLSVFVGGCTLEAVEEVCDSVGKLTLSVLDGVASLIDKSMLQTEQEDDEPRLMMLETIHEYGRERLKTSGEIEIARQAHAAYYLAFAEKVELHLIGTEQKKWLTRLERDHENLRIALDWLLQHGDDGVKKSLRLSVALWRFWQAHGHLSEGCNTLERVLRESAKFKDIPTALRARAMNAAGMLMGLQGNYRQAEAFCEQALVIFRANGDKRGIATSLNILGQIAGWKSNYERASLLTEEALALFREVDDKWGIASSLNILATMALNQGEYVKAHTFADEGLALSKKIDDAGGTAHALWLLATVIFFKGDHAKAHLLLTQSLELSRQIDEKRSLADALVLLGYVAFFQGGYDAMRPSLEEGLALHREVGDQRGIALALYGLGWVALGQGNYVKARTLYEESLTIMRKLGHQWFVALCLEGLAGVVAVQGKPAWAVRLCGVAETLRTSISAAMPPTAQVIYEQTMAAARAHLGEKAVAEILAEGRMMTIEQVLVGGQSESLTEPFAVISQPPLPQTKLPGIYPHGLTAREVEVLRLVAQGLTDGQIGKQLVISPRTVNTHLTSIYGKIGASSRSTATRYAIEQNLI